MTDIDKTTIAATIRANVPPPRDVIEREIYERELAAWLNSSELVRHVEGFGRRWGGYDPTLAY